MKKVLLVNGGKVPHYRLPVYRYLSDYFKERNLTLTVLSEGLGQGDSADPGFSHLEVKLSFSTLRKVLLKSRPDVVIFWVGSRPYMFPVILQAKLLGIKVIHWGHRRPMHSNIFLKGVLYNIEHWLDDAVILYSESLKQHVSPRFHKKTFVANNTLNLTGYASAESSVSETMKRYSITTKKNIICIARMQPRRRINDLVEAFKKLKLPGVGLILAGPDEDGILNGISGEHIYKTGAVYGTDAIELLKAADVYSIPGAIGLGIVDAFYCSLPVVTEDVLHGPEIMYLKDGVNGFMVKEGDVTELAARLKLLLTDDSLRKSFSEAAKKEIMTNGHVDRMCEGFKDAVEYACNR